VAEEVLIILEVQEVPAVQAEVVELMALLVKVQVLLYKDILAVQAAIQQEVEVEVQVVPVHRVLAQLL
jgi:hypothetical protein